MTRPARVVIYPDALRHNLSRVRQFAPGARVMAIVKADAYSHGIERVARSLPDADAFGVACLEEAQQLRAAGTTRPIVLLEGPYSGAELPVIAALGLDIVVHNAFQLELLERESVARPLHAWLKIDTGMHRLGFAPHEASEAWGRLAACETVAPPAKLMTHLALAGRRSHPMTGEQLRVFEVACRGLKGERSMANSAGIVAWPEARGDWVRPGLMLYGVSPLDGGTAADLDLRPAMALQSELISIRDLKRGDTVGYGADWTCPEDMRVGIVAAGYADGFPRHARSGAPVVVGGQRTCAIGFASMDMLAVDLRPVPDARLGERVELWGPSLPLEELARHAETIPYEILCGVHKRLRYEELPWPA